MGLKGKISEFGIADIFQLISVQKKSGALTIKSAKGKMVFFLQKGEIVNVTPDVRSRDQLIGQMLVDGGIMTEGERDLALRDQKRKGKKLGELLREKKVVKEDLLSRFLSIQIKECFFKSLNFRDGEYDFDSYTIKDSLQIRKPVRIEQLLMEGMQFLDEFPLIMEKFPAKGILVKRKEGSEKKVPAADMAMRRLFGVMADYMEPIKHIRRAELAEFEGYKALAGLNECGALLIKERKDRSEKVEYREKVRGRLRIQSTFNILIFAGFAFAIIYFIYSIIINSGIMMVLAEIFKGF